MSYVRKVKRRPFADKVLKFLKDFTDLEYDGAKIICIVCNKPLMCWDKTDCKSHVNSAQHIYKKSGLRPAYTEFMFDFIYMLLVCNLPFTLITQPPFRDFWNKYNPTWKLPGRSTLQSNLRLVRERTENIIKSALENKNLWLCVGLMTDCKQNSVVNVIVRALEPLQPSCSFLLASKRVQSCAANVITKVVLDTLNKFELSAKQLLMFVSDDAENMQCVGRSLQNVCPNLLHITCKLHALHLVAEMIQQCHPEVDELISETKTVFLKNPKRFQEFHKRCPDIPEPPQPILTRWGTWLQTALYYFKYFQEIKSAVLQFDPKEAAAIYKSQIKFEDSQFETDLQSINNNYKGIVDAIDKLQDPSLSLIETLRILDDVHTLLDTLSGTKSDCVKEEFRSILDQNLDFVRLKQISSDEASASTDPLNHLKQYFNYANVTSSDLERSFSLYKDIYSPRRTLLAETTVETYLMLQIFDQANAVSHSDTDNITI